MINPSTKTSTVTTSAVPRLAFLWTQIVVMTGSLTMALKATFPPDWTEAASLSAPEAPFQRKLWAASKMARRSWALTNLC